jgi:hypothetical protein
MVGKYDGPNDDPARISCIPHRWFKCKFSHDLNIQRKGEKIDIYSDTRDEGIKVWHKVSYISIPLVLWMMVIFLPFLYGFRWRYG